MTGLSEFQAGMLRALDRLGAHDESAAVTAQAAGARTGQSPDGAAYTLRSLVKRELVGRAYGEASGYWLTTAGLELARQP
jgi:DNA-binding IscR family transcriptional regulator